uniref:Casein kinase II subunit beta n=2 Tax=Moniliophthora roreri TaxID=221103 RepID=A0A0W0FK04_MONRR
MDPSQAEFEEEEVISGTGEGEGDEIMEEVEEGYTSSTPTSTLTWISWFCSLPGHEYFCEVTEDFIEDDFNLTGLNTMVPFWKEAMEMVLDVEPDEEASKIPDVSIVESSAEMLYGLVHQRYILTRVGLQAMVDKYEAGIFGSCPRVYCVGCNVVPCGRSDTPGLDTVKLFCPNCNDIYTPPSSRFQGVDGAFFGTTFAHLFFQTYRELAPAPFWKAPSSSSISGGSPRSSASSAAGASAFENPNPHGGQKKAAGYVYVPRIYGFKVSERAKSGPRMQWLRLRPESPEELEMVDWRGRWIDEDDEYDDEEEEEEEDRRMEDFDPDAVDDEEDEEEEEEEEDGGKPIGHAPSRKYAAEPEPTQSARTAPTAAAGNLLRVIRTPFLPRDTSDGKRSCCTSRDAARYDIDNLKTSAKMARSNLRVGLNKGHPITPIAKVQRPSQRKGIQSTKTKFVRSVVREVAGFSAYERRVMELLRNSKDKKARKLTKKRLGTLLRSKRKIEELSSIIQESRRAGH